MTKKIEINSPDDLQDSLIRILDKISGNTITNWVMYVESEDENGRIAAAISVDTDDTIQLIENMADCMQKMFNTMEKKRKLQ